MKKVILIVIVTLLMNSSLAIAEITPALTIEQFGSYGSSGTDSTYGWEFTVSQDIQVVGLGIFDFEDDPMYGPGLLYPHEIGMWHGGDLIYSTTIPAGTDTLLVDDFRYAEIDPFWLDAGETYIIGNNVFGDPIVGNSSSAMISILPYITYNRTLLSSAGSGFSLPTIEQDAYYLLGPNFLVIPEPMTLMLFGLGAVIISRRSGMSKLR